MITKLIQKLVIIYIYARTINYQSNFLKNNI